jgi:hypothetical protein
MLLNCAVHELTILKGTSAVLCSSMMSLKDVCGQKLGEDGGNHWTATSASE